MCRYLLRDAAILVLDSRSVCFGVCPGLLQSFMFCLNNQWRCTFYNLLHKDVWWLLDVRHVHISAHPPPVLVDIRRVWCYIICRKSVTKDSANSSEISQNRDHWTRLSTSSIHIWASALTETLEVSDYIMVSVIVVTFYEYFWIQLSWASYK